MTSRDAFLLATLLFWNGVVIYAIKCPRQPVCAPTATGTAPAAAGYTLAEVARHSRPDDCWVAVGGQVYDVTGFIDLHPGDTELLKSYCGKESTTPYAAKESGKDRGKPHTARADSFLEAYLKGPLLPR